MKHDRAKVRDATLALMALTTFKDTDGFRAWKGLDWETLDELHAAGLIDNPRTKARSVALTDEGRRRSDQLFWRMFAKSEEDEKPETTHTDDRLCCGPCEVCSKRRAERAGEAMDYLADLYGNAANDESIVDLLADVLHFNAHVAGGPDLDRALRLARSHFEEETPGPSISKVISIKG